MAGKHEYKVLTGAFGRDDLLEQGKNNAVNWQEDKHEGVNWLRFSRALIDHIDQGKPFHMDDADPEMLNQMLDQYHQIRDMHKQTMVPHVRAAMSKIHSLRGDTSADPMSYLNEAYDHLEANGGHSWAEKVRTLTNLNNHIKKLSDRIHSTGQ